jgi:hypothetical protein
LVLRSDEHPNGHVSAWYSVDICRRNRIPHRSDGSAGSNEPVLRRSHVGRTTYCSRHETQISTPGFELNDAFKKLDISLSFVMHPISATAGADELVDVLREVESADTHALLCFNHGYVKGKYEPFSGHVTVFDRVIDGKIRIVDASWKQPKWRFIESERLYEALRLHGEDTDSAGIWHLRQAD